MPCDHDVNILAEIRGHLRFFDSTHYFHQNLSWHLLGYRSVFELREAGNLHSDGSSDFISTRCE